MAGSLVWSPEILVNHVNHTPLLLIAYLVLVCEKVVGVT